MWDIVVGFVKGALGIKSSYSSSSSTYLGAGLAMYTGLFIWFLMIAALVDESWLISFQRHRM